MAREVRPFLRRNQAGADHLGVIDQLREAALNVLELVDLGRLRHREGEPHHELGLGQVLGDELVGHRGMRLGTAIDGVAGRDVTIDEHALPRHQHVIEDRHAVGLVVADRERMIEGRAGARLRDARAADEPQPRRRDRDGKADGVGLRLFGLRHAARRRRHHDELVGIGRERRQHARAADDDPFVVVGNGAGGEVLLLRRDAARAVDLGIGQGMGRDAVALARAFVMGAHVRAVLGPERVGGRREGAGEDVEKVGRTTEHPERPIVPAFHRRAPATEVILGLGLDERHPDARAGRRRHVCQRVAKLGAMLQVVEPGDRAGGAGKAAVARDVGHPLAVDIDRTPVPEARQHLAARAYTHRTPPDLRSV